MQRFAPSPIYQKLLERGWGNIERVTLLKDTFETVISLDFVQFPKCYFQSDTERRNTADNFLHRVYLYIRTVCSI